MNRTWTAAAFTLPMFFITPQLTEARGAGTTPPIRSMSCGPIDSASAPAAKIDDPTIVAIFDAANTADIETGEIAAKRGQTKEVREFGAMLVRDHKMVRQKGRDLAKQLGVTPTPLKGDKSAEAHAKAMATLRSAKAADFDRAFLQHEIAFHKAVLDAMNGTLVPAIKNSELKTLVTQVAPAFQAHMMAAQNLLNGKTASMSH